MNIQEQGVCPKCGEMNLIYGSTEFEGESVSFEFDCPDCRAKGKEWYFLEYTESVID